MLLSAMLTTLNSPDDTLLIISNWSVALTAIVGAAASVFVGYVSLKAFLASQHQQNVDHDAELENARREAREDQKRVDEARMIGRTEGKAEQKTTDEGR